MTPYTILTYPDIRLFHESKNVLDNEFDDSLKMIIDRLFITMRVHEGIGLAAPQVNIHKRIIVIAFDNHNLTLINPVIIEKSSDIDGIVEGCLSVPNVSGYVERSKDIKIRYRNLDGSYSELKATGLLAICIQHEIDHLNGVIYINRMSNIRKIILLKKYKRLSNKE